jgi:peptidoglycan/LPS O-acetylase OafA/YrhL
MRAAPKIFDPNASRIEGLDLLRLLAVVAVMLFHFAFRGAAADGLTEVSLPSLIPFAKFGHFGVDVFFVISGFVISQSAERRSAVEFAIARFGRIYPAFIFCMTVTCLITLAAGAPRFSTSIDQWFANLFIFSPMLKQPFMDGAYWSIVYEITFYGWVFLLILAGVFRTRLDAIVMIWTAITLWNTYFPSSMIGRLFLTDQSGFFICGILIHEFWRGRRDGKLYGLLVLSTSMAVMQGIQTTVWIRAHYVTHFDDAVVALVAFGSIAVVALAVCVRRSYLPPGLVIAIGGLTYPLYLLHQNIGYMILNQFRGMVSDRILVEATIVGLIAVAWIVWRFVDRPGQTVLKRSLHRLRSWAVLTFEHRTVARAPERA